MAFLNRPIKTYILKIWSSVMWRVQLYVTQPCLHTLMQTRLSANQSARTILVILYIYIYISWRIKDDASILCDSEFRA